MPAVDNDGLTLVSIITAPSRDRECTAHSRAWRIPAASAEAFAQAMTERYGPPVQEGLSTVSAMRDVADRAAEDGFLFTSREEDPPDGPRHPR
jgi:hypothetical protein